MAEQIKYISLDNLTKYDSLIKAQMAKNDAYAIKVAAIEGHTLKFYTDVPPVGAEAVPAFTIEIPETDLSDINAKLTTLIGEDANKSVRTIAAEELARQLIPDDAKESLDTLQEISTWIQTHPDEAAAMNKDIENIKKLIGSIPEGATATDIVGYIAEAVKKETDRATEIEGGLRSDVDAIKNDYLKAADKTELEGKVTAERERAEGAETALDNRLKAVEAATGAIITATEDDINALFGISAEA